ASRYPAPSRRPTRKTAIASRISGGAQRKASSMYSVHPSRETESRRVRFRRKRTRRIPPAPRASRESASRRASSSKLGSPTTSETSEQIGQPAERERDRPERADQRDPADAPALRNDDPVARTDVELIQRPPLDDRLLELLARPQPLVAS